VPIADIELLDQRKQTEHVHVPDGTRPPVFTVKAAVLNDKGVMEMWDGSDVPGVTGQGACTEIVCVTGKIADDYLEDFKGKPCDRRRGCRRGNTPPPSESSRFQLEFNTEPT